MGNYISLNPDIKKGQMYLSKDVFITIGKQALKDVSGVIKKTQEEEKSKPSIYVSFRRNKIVYKFHLILDKSASKEIIEEEITSNLSNLIVSICDALPFEVSFTFINKKEK